MLLYLGHFVNENKCNMKFISQSRLERWFYGELPRLLSRAAETAVSQAIHDARVQELDITYRQWKMFADSSRRLEAEGWGSWTGMTKRKRGQNE